MTRLSAPALADLARRNDLHDGDVVTAIATALAASAGDPAYRVTVNPGPAADYQGLWGVDVVEFPALGEVDLSHPEEAARVMAELCRDTGGFGWCPAWRANAHRPHLARATPAASMLPGPSRDDPAITGDLLRSPLQWRRDQFTARTDAIARRSVERIRP